MENQEDKIKQGLEEEQKAQQDRNSKQGHVSQENQITQDLQEEPKTRTQQSGQNQDNQEEEEDNTPLFREEAMQAKKGSYFGKTLIITPVSFSVWTFGIFAIALVI
jgi:hypothetical protein